VASVFQYGDSIETEYKGQGRILSMFTSLGNYDYFVPISDNPNVFKIPDFVLGWFSLMLPSRRLAKEI
jgi:hypothetical protein